MDILLDKTAVVMAISCAGLFFMTGLITGVWKFYEMLRSDKFKAPYYVDIAHRSALLYSFAAILIAVFSYFSPFSTGVNVIATASPLLFFAIAIINYIKLGLENTTNNQLKDSENISIDKGIMVSLIVAEIGGFSVLLVGFFIQVFS